ncbi:MAG: DUF1844 domain-containing protein [Acidobacteria bacterium]|nr:MAG: DUF1844 domain-containing protein [Acidobacteriota bacterium]REJ99259.1 MAG: DUF1844 domain-containing protein [Acidobacteriota bacterium]REK16020.1 MAG: DUF1844 domain-containing protein [Acidobacteriota bacterium]REK43701.1 MAG: DUF1844 domain-containing protein [Acidobacteriota bacterium]
MIGNQEPNQEEEPELKVTDKRKFNPDGSVRDGVIIEPEPESPEPEPVSSTVITEPEAAPQTTSAATAPAEEEPLLEEDDEEHPASFVNFLSTLVTNAAVALGAIPHPVSGQTSSDIDAGKYWIDVLLMLREKTKNNLTPTENHLFENVLADLQLQYVKLSRAAEEKLKAQAAKKFSSKDILGG